MRKELKWIAALCAREWNYWEMQLLKSIRAELMYLVVMFLLFIVNRSLGEKVFGCLSSMPIEVRSFWGVSGSIAGWNSFFCMWWTILPLNVWVAWETCYCAEQSVWREEEGGIFILCNQWYNRYQIGIAKYIWSVVNFVINYAIICAAYMALALFAGYSGLQSADGLWYILGIFLKGIFVITMLASLCGCHAMLDRGKRRVSLSNGLVLGTLMIGNLYKIFDVAALCMKRAGRDYAGFVRWTGWTKGLRWLSPLSWLNPFTEFGVWRIVLQLLICMIVTGGAAALGLNAYRVRRLDCQF